MSKKIALLVWFSAFILVSFSPAMAGPSKNLLHDHFCRTMSPDKKLGCNGYLQYRIEMGKARQESLDRCIWGCGKVLDDYNKVQACQNGCRTMHENDR